MNENNALTSCSLAGDAITLGIDGDGVTAVICEGSGFLKNENKFDCPFGVNIAFFGGIMNDFITEN